MKDKIELTPENINNINSKNIVEVTKAEGGAMGEPNGFYTVLNNYDLYHTNFGSTQLS